MQVALISDIHANFEALATLLDMLESVDRILCLGDLVGYYCQVNEVIEVMRRLDAVCVLGNHDSFLLEDRCPSDASQAVRFGINYAAATISAANRQWLGGLPLVWGGLVGDRSFLLAHGSPWRPLEDYLYADNVSLTALDSFSGFEVIAFGQTHRSYQRIDRMPYLLNPGSIGQSREQMSVATALVIDTESMSITQIKRLYDPAPVMYLAKSQGAGPWITKHLQS